MRIKYLINDKWGNLVSICKTKNEREIEMKRLIEVEKMKGLTRGERIILLGEDDE